MAIPPVIKEIDSDVKQLEHGKFAECPAGSGMPAVKTKIVQDDPIDVSFSPGLPSGYSAVNIYGTASLVPSGSNTTVATYTVPVAGELVLSSVEVSGGNVAEYTIEVNNIVVAKRRTYWTDFNSVFGFDRFTLSASDTIDVKVLHNRTTASDFDARIIGIES